MSVFLSRGFTAAQVANGVNRGGKATVIKKPYTGNIPVQQIEMTPTRQVSGSSGRALQVGSSEGAPSDADVAQTGETVKEQATAARSADEIKTEETQKLMAESAGVDPAELAGFYQEKSRQYRVMMQNATVAGRAIEADMFCGEVNETVERRNAAPSTGTRGNTGNGSGGMPGARYSIDKYGNVVVDDEVSLNAVEKTLREIYDGKYKRSNFTFPILKNTPQVYIDYCRMNGNCSFVTVTSKAYNAMQNKAVGNHGLGVMKFLEVIKNLGDPSYIIYQNKGENAGHYVSIIEINEGEIVAAVDIGNYRNGIDAIKGENGFYNVLITAFDPQDGYIEGLLEDDSNDIVYDRKEEKRSINRTLP